MCMNVCMYMMLLIETKEIHNCTAQTSAIVHTNMSAKAPKGGHDPVYVYVRCVSGWIKEYLRKCSYEMHYTKQTPAVTFRAEPSTEYCFLLITNSECLVEGLVNLTHVALARFY